MRKIFSIGLWCTGGLFFLFSALVLVVCLHVFSKETTFSIARRLFGLMIRLMGIKLSVTGVEHINPDQSYLIMGNHQSLFDLFVVPAAIPLCFNGLEAAYHFSLPVWGYLIRKWGNIPIERNNLESAILSLEAAEKSILSGMSLAVLPEGHRTLTGEMAPFKKGPFYLAKGAKADILPFGINGLFRYQGKGRLILSPGRVSVNIGEPIPYEAIKDLSVEKIRQNIFDVVNALSKK